MFYSLTRWLPAVLWAAFIFYLSSFPDLRSSLPDFWDLVLRKFAHAGEYAVLAVLTVWALKDTKNAFIAAGLLVVLYAASDEFHQSFVPGRFAALLDFGIDVVGGAIGLLAYFLATKGVNKKPAR